jgi:amino acid transporter
VAALLNNVWIAIVLVVSFAVVWPLICYISFLQPTRMIFAYAFDGILPNFVTKVSRSGSPYVAVIIATVLSIATYYWALHASNFLQVLVYAVLFQLVGMMLVGLAAIVFPWRRPELYRASSTTATLAGIPMVTIAGAGAFLSGLILWVLYLAYPQLGLADKVTLVLYFVGVVVAAIAFYFLVRAVRSRQGVDLSRTYAEIPPE